jgi:conjugative relaxase-like TrwC/TraI family protein
MGAMVRFDHPCRSIEGALDYFSEHMGKGDYLSQGGSLQMVWYGQGAERLGLHGEVQAEQFTRLCAGKHPDTGEKLTVREKANRRVCYFAQLSAPKDVSIALLVGEDKRIEAWWQESVQETLREIEAVTETRVRGGGRKDEDRVTGNMVAAVVTHDASRSLDPQLHTHLCVMNVTYDGVEKRWKGVQPSNYFRFQSFFREVSYNKLAQRMTEGGYELERSRSIGFEIKGFPASVRKQFSKRRDKILEKAAQLGVSDQNSLQAITSKTRADKQKISAAELRSAWRRECGDHLDEIERVIREARMRRPAVALSGRLEAVDYALAHLFERQSVVNERIILREALDAGRGRVQLSQLRDELERRITQGSLIRHRDEITSREALAMEAEFIHWVRSDWDKYARMGDDRAIGRQLKADHREAVRKILRCRNRVIVLQGDAGTGKTTSLKEILKGVEAAGGAIFACAPSSKATAELRDELTPEAETIQSLLVNRQLQQKIAGRTIIVDEAGLLSVRQLRDLCRLAKANHNRLILVGDIKQHRSVEAGDALRAIQKYCEVETVRLTEIVRQRDPAYRKVVEFLAAKKPYDAFKQLEKLGEVHEAKNASDLFERAADDYLQTITSGKSCLAIAPVWKEIEAFTDVVREKLKAKGLVKGSEREVMVTASFGWTEAQRKRVENYNPGDVLQFHRETVAFSRDESVKMIELRGERLVVERENGDRCAFDPKRIHSFDVGEARKIRVASGERLLIQGNLKAEEIKNGDIVEVAGFGDDGSIRLKDGRSLRSSFRQYTYGYAATSHAAQGKTVDRGILILGEAGLRAANLQQAYVSNSRFRERQTVYTTNRKAAKHAMATDNERRLAHELHEKLVRQWRVIEGLMIEGEGWKADRQRVRTAMQGETPSINPGGMRHAA